MHSERKNAWACPEWFERFVLAAAFPKTQGAKAASSGVGSDHEQRSRPIDAVSLEMQQSIIVRRNRA
jgi:hypothetical protein